MTESNRQGSHTGPGGDRPVVLIVEDEQNLADLYAEYLKDEYEIRVSYTGEQALEHIDNDVDVALLDRNLEHWTGDELLTVIQDRKIHCQTAMVTAVYPDFDIVDLSIDTYLTKPVSRAELRETVEELLLWQLTDIDQQELLALISRKIALEREKTDRELERSDGYSKLKQRIKLASDRLDLGSNSIENTSNKYRPSVCRQCDLRWDVSVDNTVGFLKLGSAVWKCVRCGNIQKYRERGGGRVVR